MAGVPAALNKSLDEIIAERKAAPKPDRGADAPDDRAAPRRRRRGGRGRSGGGGGGGGGSDAAVPARGGVDKPSSSRGGDAPMGDAAKKRRRRSGKPRPARRPLLPAHRVGGDGAIEVLFDGACVARVGVNGTVTLDTTALPDRTAARSAPLRRAVAAALEPLGIVLDAEGEGDAIVWSVTAPGGAVAPFVDGMTVAAAADAAAMVAAHLTAGRVAKKAGAVPA